MPNEALREELLLLRFAERPSIRFVSLEWKEMSSIVAIVRNLRSKKYDPLSQRNEELLANTVKLIFRLADGPFDLSDPLVGLDSLLSETRQAIPMAGSEHEEIKNLEQALLALASTRHPARSFLEEFISSRPEIEAGRLYERFGDPAIVLCPRDIESLPAIEKWIADENLFVSLSRYRELKKSPPFPCQVLFGPPSRYEGWGRTPEKNHRAQWLVTTPRAEEVLFLIWPPFREPSLEELSPWPGFKHLINPSTPREEQESQPEIEEFEVRETSPPTFEPHASLVDAKRLEIQGPEGSLWVYFEISEAPYPKVLKATDSDEMESTFPSSGEYLIFRNSRSEHARLQSIAEQWWDTRIAEPAYAKAIGEFEEIRNTMTACVEKLGVSAFTDELISYGVRRNYSRYVAKRLLVPQYLAPEQFRHFQAIGKVCGEDWTEADFARIKMIRASRAQAGRLHFRELLEELRNYKGPDLEEELARFGYALPAIGNGEPLLISRVVSISPGLHKIPSSKLGLPLKEDGLSWLE